MGSRQARRHHPDARAGERQCPGSHRLGQGLWAGIAPEHLPRLTERFYRVDNAASRAQGGTGLGLALVKHILNRHRGRLTIESAPGTGANFAVRLPLAPPPNS